MRLIIGSLIFCCFFGISLSYGQGGVGIGVLTPNPNAVLELVSPGNNQGLLVPKMTSAQRTAATFMSALSTTEAGLIVFDTDDNKFYFWLGSAWQTVGTSIPQDLQLIGSTLTITNNPNATPIDLSPFAGTNTDDQTLSYTPATGQLTISTLSSPQSVTITTAGAAGGSLTGTYPSPSLADNSVTSATIVDGTITAADLSNLSIDDTKLASGITVAKLTPGSNGQVLTTTAGTVSWNTPATGSVSSIATGTGLTGGPITTAGTISLANTAVAPGNYGSASSVPQISVDAQGRITAATGVTISGVAPGGVAGGDLAGSYPNPTVTTSAITSAKILDGTIADADVSPSAAIAVSKFSPGTNGQILTTSAGISSWTSPSFGTVTSVGTGTGLSGGPVTGSGTISLANTTVAAGSYGTATSVSQITVDAQGRITSAASVPVVGVAPGGVAGGDLTGNYPNPTVTASAITSAKILDGTIVDADVSPSAAITVSKFLPGTNGQILTTSAGISSWASPSFGTVTSVGTGTGLTGGPVTGAGTISLANTAVTPGTYGAATSVSQITVDAQGRITSASSVPVTGVAPGGAAGGDLTGNYPNPTVAASAITSAKILDATIVDADISTTAAISVSKFSAGAGGQVLTTSGGIPQWANPSGSVLINNAGTRNLFAGSPVGTSTGTDNAFYGPSAGNANTSGNYNVIMGSGAGQDKTVGDLNTLIGWLAGMANGSTASYNGNTFIGAQAGQVSTGGPCTFIGEKAGWNNTTGTQSLFCGNRAGMSNTTGTQNTILGYFADVVSANLQNATAIGYSTIVDASNKVRIGNTVVTVIEGQVPFTSPSDKRYKTDITSLTSGLDFIQKLNPVSYHMKNSAEARINWGFIAQEIEQLVGTDNAILTIGADKDRHLGLRYTDFIAPLVKAVQEQQTEIGALQDELLKKEARIQKLEEQFQLLKAEANQAGEMKSDLEKIKKAMGL